MAYVVLARKCRPQMFDEVIGQGHITELLKKSIVSERLAQAYLFCGPRGIGKTSCARILAKSLNCHNGPTVHPCGQCPACVDISQANSFDVIEIDGASNRGIDEVRTLRENVKFAPSSFRYKVYIIDEVHMLTAEAFNALLKTLEEPPAYVKFIFATTEPHKLPDTILSRCQRFDFKRIALKTIAQQLLDICKTEKIKVDQDAIYAIAKAAMGSVRDALSILDQLSALDTQTINANDVSSMLGVVETDQVFKIIDALLDKNCANALATLDEILSQGKDANQLLKDLIEHFRHLMIVNVSGKTLGHLIDYPVSVKDALLVQSEKTTLKEILNAIDILLEGLESARVLDSLRISLEVAFARITYTEPCLGISQDSKPSAASKTKPSALDMISNKKGHLDFSTGARIPTTSKPDAALHKLEDPTALKDTSQLSEMNIENIRKMWDALTFAVSRQKMSLATYLQEGLPCDVSESKITVGFLKETSFHKETLEDRNNTTLLETILSEHLNRRIKLEFKIISEVPGKEDDPLVKGMIEKFQGKVIHRWHRHHP